MTEIGMVARSALAFVLLMVLGAVPVGAAKRPYRQALSSNEVKKLERSLSAMRKLQRQASSALNGVAQDREAAALAAASASRAASIGLVLERMGQLVKERDPKLHTYQATLKIELSSLLHDVGNIEAQARRHGLRDAVELAGSARSVASTLNRQYDSFARTYRAAIRDARLDNMPRPDIYAELRSLSTEVTGEPPPPKPGKSIFNMTADEFDAAVDRLQRTR